MNMVTVELLSHRSSSGTTILFFEDSGACLNGVIAIDTSYFCLVPGRGQGLL